VSGNPAGMKPGTKHKTTQIAEALIDGQAEKIIRKIVKLALEGDTSLLRWLGDRLTAARKERPLTFELPKITSADDALLSSRLILAGAVNGLLTPDEALSLSKILESHAKLYEQSDLEKLLNKIERERGLGTGGGLQ
jgi:hypothetical protein